MNQEAVRVLQLGCAVLLCSLWSFAGPSAAQQVVTAGQVSVTLRSMQPNLLFIYVDDLNTDIDLSVVSTPNIDKLAASGVVAIGRQLRILQRQFIANDGRKPV